MADYGFVSFGGPSAPDQRATAGRRRTQSAPAAFLDTYLSEFTPTKPADEKAVAPIIAPGTILTESAESFLGTPAEQTGAQDIGFGLTAEGKPIVDSYGSYSGFTPKIEKRDGQFYVGDNRGYGPFKGKMHQVSESMANMQARKAAAGMTRYLMPNPNPEQFSKTIEAGGITGTMTPSYVLGGGTVVNPQFNYSGPLNLESYNKFATALQTSRDPGFDPTSRAASPTTTSNYDISASPGLAMRMGMPISAEATAAEIARRRGTPVDESAMKRAEWRIGNQLYRKNVAGGYAEPGTYARQGGGIPRGSSWGQVSRGR